MLTLHLLQYQPERNVESQVYALVGSLCFVW